QAEDGIRDFHVTGVQTCALPICFVLLPADHHFQATLALGELGMTTSQDVLFAIADGQGPARHLIALGYAGWGAGQLEAELAQNRSEERRVGKGCRTRR